MKIKPIRTEAQYEAVLSEIDKLLDAPEHSPAEEKLELLSILVEAYEREHYPIDPPDPVEAIKFAMEQQGMKPRDLEPLIGTRSRVYEVMHKKRPLTLSMIRKLRAGLGISADVLIGKDGAFA